MRLFSEAATTANDDNDNNNENDNDSENENGKGNEETTPDDQPSDHNEKTAAVIVPENGATVKFVSDGDVATSSRNGPTDVPSTSVDAVVETAKNDKDKKAKEEKPKAVGIFALVTFLFCIFCQNIVYSRQQLNYLDLYNFGLENHVYPKSIIVRCVRRRQLIGHSTLSELRRLNKFYSSHVKRSYMRGLIVR